jgi:hypothetical protein
MKPLVLVSSSERWGNYPNISQIMKKTIPQIFSMFRNFAAVA